MKKLTVIVLIIWVIALSGCGLLNTPITPTPVFKGLECNDNYELTFGNSGTIDDWAVLTCSPLQPNHSAVTNIDYKDSYTIIGNAALSKSWTIPYKDFMWASERFQYLATVRWSQDGNYVFLTPAGSSSGIFYHPMGFIDGYILYRFNLNTGVLETILPFDEQGYAFSPSQYNQYLAYVAPSEKGTIHILNLTSQDKRKTEVKGDCADVGGFVWKSDGINLIFVCKINGLANESSGTSIFSLNTNNMEIKTILKNDKRLLFPTSLLTKDRNGSYWTDTGSLFLESQNDNKMYVLDINTGTVTPVITYTLIATATPKP